MKTRGRKRKHEPDDESEWLPSDAEQDDTEATYLRSITAEARKKLLDELKRVNALVPTTPLKFHILGSNLPLHAKRVALTKLHDMTSTEGGDTTKIRQWLDGLLLLPFGKVTPQPLVRTADNATECSEFVSASIKRLDAAVHGMQDVKINILETIAEWVLNPAQSGNVIALQGPMGVGKTSFVKDGISKIFGRPFVFVGLGGATNAEFLKGHSYTWEGSLWGQMASCLMSAGCMNPVIFFDELDKVSDSNTGKEVIATLLHLTDPTQNSHFHDNYFSDIPLDFSQCLFVFSFNDESKVSPILKDRMTVFRLPGYSKAEKKTIAQDFVAPKMSRPVLMSDDAWDWLLDKHCPPSDPGVRNMIRALEIISRRLGLLELAGDNADVKKLPFWVAAAGPTLTLDETKKLLAKSETTDADKLDPSIAHMYT